MLVKIKLMEARWHRTINGSFSRHCAVVIVLFTFLLSADTNAQVTQLSGKLVFAEVHPWETTKIFDGYWSRWDSWGQNPNNMDIMSTYWPLNGPYSCSDCNYAATIGNDLKAAGVDVAVIDWIDFYPNEQKRVETLLKCLGMPVVVMVDAEPAWTGSTYTDIISRLDTAISYAKNMALYPNYFRDSVSGKPLYFVWDPLGVGKISQWNPHLNSLKSQSPGGIFVTGGSNLDSSMLTNFDGQLFLNGTAKDPLSIYNWVLYKLATGSNNQFSIGMTIPGFSPITLCDTQNHPPFVPRTPERFDTIWQAVINASYTGKHFAGAYTAYNNDGEDHGIEPVSANPPLRGSNWVTCNGKVPQTYGTYCPLKPDFYLKRNMDWSRVFNGKAAITSVPPVPPVNLFPHDTVLAAGTTTVTVTWNSVPGAQSYLLNAYDDTDPSAADPRSNCSWNPPILLCLDNITTTTEKIIVTSGHSYRWTLRARKTGAPWICSEETGCRQFSVLPSATGTTENYNSAIPCTVSPNPFNSSTVVSSAMKNCEIRIFDVMGNVLRSFSNVNQFPFTIERGNISSGIYVLEFNSGKNTERTKLLVQ